VESLNGKISDRLRRQLSPTDPAWTAKRSGAEPPSAESVRTGEGHGLGQGAARARSGEGAQTDGA
jgi:hypothetical protein